MADIFYSYYILRRRAKQRRIVKRRRLLHRVRAKYDAFVYTEEVFKKLYRLPKSLCRALIMELEQYDTQASTINFEKRLLATLHFLGHGSDQHCVGNSFNTAMSQPTISRTIFAICKLIVERKGHEIRFPETAAEQNAAKLGFFRQFQIQGTIGAIDCTHVSIVTPTSGDAANPQKAYMNRKGFYSINVEAICDHRMVFTAMNAQYPGSCHDSGIWKMSVVRSYLESTNRPGQTSWLLGDQGYPLEPWLLTPFAAPDTNGRKKFNALHIRARNVIQRAFGVLKGRFRCLSKLRVLNYTHERAANIIYACVILHNILTKNTIQLPQSEEEVDEDIGDGDHNSDSVSDVKQMSLYREGVRRREAYASSL